VIKLTSSQKSPLIVALKSYLLSSTFPHPLVGEEEALDAKFSPDALVTEVRSRPHDLFVPFPCAVDELEIAVKLE